MSVVIETSVGDLVIDLYVEERPNCCKNFLKLCKIKYYHFCLFHNVQQNYIAQTGDPTGTGRGGESIFSFAYGDQAKYFEMEKFPKIKHRKLGTVSMINNGQDMHGSQFMITLSTDLDYLDGKHTVFGEVAKGFDVIEKLNECICDRDGRPYQDIRIFHTVILFDPFEDFEALRVENGRASPEPTEEKLASDRIRVDEDVDQLEGMTQEEIDDYMKKREAQTRAKLLEIIGDIPDADIKPPENVLFVCKLNPVTTDEDLELIFSRFGKINSCEVIRDKKTGDSLCYAFIDFDREEDCENAYFKMDNVLIDDRRIHVDFSQSVAKAVWKGKGTGTGYFADNRNFKMNDEEKEKPKYRIKDTTRKGAGYNLVFDDNEHSERDRKYEPIRKDYRHGRNEPDQYKKGENKYYKDKERERKGDRSRERDRDDYRKRDDDRSEDKYRDRDKKRSYDKDEHRNGKHRNRSSSREREKEREKERERHRYDDHRKTSSSSSSRRH